MRWFTLLLLGVAACGHIPGADQTTGRAMHTYELMIITHGSLSEDAVSTAIDRFTKTITDLGGSVERVDHWGKREFAYEIDHMREGYYTVIDLQLSGDGLDELERQLRISDEVVRHKAIRPDLRRRKVS